MKKLNKPTFLLIIGIVLAIVTFLTSFKPTQAAEVNMSGITTEDAVLTDSNGNDITNSDQLNPDQTYKATYNWTISNGQVISNGDTATLQLPKNVSTDTNLIISVKDASGNYLGTLTIPKDSTTGTILFSQPISSADNDIQGIISFSVVPNSNTTNEEPNTTDLADNESDKTTSPAPDTSTNNDVDSTQNTNAADNDPVVEKSTTPARIFVGDPILVGDGPETPSVANNSGLSSSAVNPTHATVFPALTNKLPQAGNKSDDNLTFIGMGLLILVTGISYLIWRRKKID
ncbi:Ig-like domain-containing protein [Companilactobacillus sp.]|uniref:Ig-like domain-containing protein n=1 Tax=Companilactobacillus sp. TaxID=2767905 RepID=UPI0025C2D93B|nr:Ig-like domain-containing protein [Companilactobacillus sp.]MCH4010009.1 Ig-like domain-containing protein [Companilactobacillus sp.]MCH4052315.1 Ig-like domain-containing protein [Companilactobacillus sp.]MCH4077951.1 Ig-like domain-containing protein [Companilactobacillus sp.]MCH4126527.1 Ig-like domain-containing protein [Companilactobacillus sp.]MCH4132113.1 Ig-like domain-containing protein [Companilactobacillus sp.]